MRYLEILPEDFLLMDPTSFLFRSSLKNWVRENIHENGDFIFRGKVEPPDKDWLESELEGWIERETHNYRSNIEILDLY